MTPIFVKALPELSKEQLTSLSVGIETQMGLHFPPARWRDMLKGIVQAAIPMGFDTVENCVRTMLAGPLSLSQIQILASELTVGETYFLREKATLDVLEHKILPELIRKRARKRQYLKVWSAGCSTGEEAYTLASILDRALPSRQGWNVQVLATDANVVSLEKAQAGRYREWSFRGTPQWFRERYFRTVDSHTLEVIPRVKKLVRFAYLNLVEDPFPSLQTDTCDVDIIFCRNVLMYFRPQLVMNVVDKFRQCLEHDGWLAVSLCETSTELYRNFLSVPFSGTTLYRKTKPLQTARFFFEPELPTFLGIPGGEEHPGLAASPADQAIVPVSPPAPPPAQREARAPLDSPARPVSRRKATAAPSGLALALEAAQKSYDRAAYDRAAGELDVALQAADHKAEDKTLLAQAKGLAARSLANLGRLETARKHCEEAVSLDPVNASLRYLLATIFLGMGNADEAKKALNGVLFLDGDHILANYSLGTIARSRGQTEQARRHFHNTLALVAPLADDHVLEDSGDMTAGQLANILRSTEEEADA
ncbi:protein-glutamate O-methyltransferase CheR [Fundidesulfovibrio butyratiphilus]